MPRTEQRKEWYMTGFFPAILYGTEVQFKSIKNYLLIVANYLESEATKFREEVDASIKSKGFTEADADHYYQEHLNEFEMWQSTFPSRIRTTVLVASCSLLEASLAEVCSYIEREIATIIKFKWVDIDDRDNGVKRAGIFLRNNISIFTEDHPKWQRILDYYHVRNVIVHADGDLDLLKGKKVKVEQALKRLKATGVHVEYGQIRISHALLEVMMEDIEAFWKSLEAAFKENAIVGPKYWP